MILKDIAREKALVKTELELRQPGSFDQIMINSLKQKLSYQVTRCNMLHKALAQQKGQFQTILEGKLKSKTISRNIALNYFLKFAFQIPKSSINQQF